MEHFDQLKQFGVTSLEETRELAEFTDSIVANLKIIEESDCDFDALREQTTAISANLKFIEESNVNLDELVERTNEIVANLKVIVEQA
jgi:hypothetical protein